MEVVASLSQGRTATAQCGLFTYKSVPVIFETPCTLHISAVICVREIKYLRKNIFNISFVTLLVILMEVTSRLV